MGKFLRLKGFWEQSLELVDSDSISAVEPHEEIIQTVTSATVSKGFFGKTVEKKVTQDTTLSGSCIRLKNGSDTYVAETVEEIAHMLEGA